jgi:beta-lactamase superfamily II metal-dependent hydrolase
MTETTTTAAPRARRAAGTRLKPPAGGATVRMYRTGHGDCFLLAFAGKSARKPVYVLIDCGYKPGSPKFIGTNARDIGASIRDATGGHIDVAVITHEHQDHVNGISATNFAGITIGETWLAWTENPDDAVANQLRTQFKDKLLGLIAAQRRLAVDADEETAKGDTEQAKEARKRVRDIEAFLAFELGGDDDDFGTGGPGLMGLMAAAEKDPANSRNKQSMKLFKDLAQNGVKYIRPHVEIMPLPGAPDVRVFALGPPRNPDKLEDLDPREEEGEEFHGLALASSSAGNYFAAAARAPESHGVSPFARRYAVPLAGPMDDEMKAFFTRHYGHAGTPEYPPVPPRHAMEVAFNPEWRRIDKEWLYSAERLALDMNDQTNNASLVLAFELGKGGKVLLFAADAQRGNWVSWGDAEWPDGGDKVSARDLLSRTVLYKVGHHGSHNATLNGVAEGAHANLGWMAHGEHGREFTAMITAVRAWAETQNGWDHPLKAIKDALIKKASGRVFQTDTPVATMAPPDGTSAADWNRFLARVREDTLYFDYEIKG